jgi:aconitate hydratase 2/2-methylisocitrate dehydratase
MLETRMSAGLALIGELKQKGHPLAYVGDVVGTDSPQP